MQTETGLTDEDKKYFSEWRWQPHPKLGYSTLEVTYNQEYKNIHKMSSEASTYLRKRRADIVKTGCFPIERGPDCTVCIGHSLGSKKIKLVETLEEEQEEEWRQLVLFHYYN